MEKPDSTNATDSAPKPSFIVRVTDWAGDQHHFGSFAEKLRAQKFANRIDRKPYGQCIVEVIDVKPAEDE